MKIDRYYNSYINIYLYLYLFIYIQYTIQYVMLQYNDTRYMHLQLYNVLKKFKLILFC